MVLNMSRHYSKHFTYNNSLNSNKFPMRLILVFLLQITNGGTERSSDLPEVHS